MTHHTFPRRFYSLDVLRGLAALGIVLWHWQHFFSPFNKQGVTLSIDQQPLFGVFYIFYQYGYLAVSLFLCLSGFIFFWLYSKQIHEKAITLGYFSVLRLSRLYPLHFATLVFVAAGQLIYFNTTSTYFVFEFNDLYHFFLNVFLASRWGLEKGFSFNAPVWLVSIQALMYLIFFVFCRIFYHNTPALIFAVIAGLIVRRFNFAIGLGLECFFLGGLVFIAYEQIVKAGDVWKVSIWLPFTASMAWLLTIGAAHPHHGLALGELPRIFQKSGDVWPVFFLFPMTIMSLALLETKRGELGKRLSFIGDISYSLYLLHFPLQLTAATAATKLAMTPQLFYSPWFMALFFSVLMVVSFASYRYFEVPVQRFLRLRFYPAVGSHV
jgi:peptidoglycan/LPS O-acetylase OafA/YrhL